MAFKSIDKGVVILIVIGSKPCDDIINKNLEEWASSGLNTEIDEIWEQERIEEERKSQETLKKLCEDMEDFLNAKM